MNINIEKFLRKIRNTKNALLVSMLIGGLVGATAMLFFAPQSGAQMRAQIRSRSTQSGDRKRIDRLSAALEAEKKPVEAAL
jgi:gas vesicle protein